MPAQLLRQGTVGRRCEHAGPRLGALEEPPTGLGGGFPSGALAFAELFTIELGHQWRGIAFARGGALLRGLDELLARSTP